MRSKLLSIYVKNIGCIGPEGVQVKLDDILCLVGPNNSGKTTILRAYELAFNQFLSILVMTDVIGLLLNNRLRLSLMFIFQKEWEM